MGKNFSLALVWDIFNWGWGWGWGGMGQGEKRKDIEPHRLVYNGYASLGGVIDHNVACIKLF